MPRGAREISNSGFYHIIFRGVNHQNIFEEDADYKYMLETMKKVQKEIGFEVHAYCLMTNHVHLLIKEKQMGDIIPLMRKILIKYALYFNRKYGRSGALIANRYKSKPVETDAYFIPLVIYIHQNPVRAGLVKSPYEYVYSSYREYFDTREFVCTDFVLSLIAPQEFAERHAENAEGSFVVPEGVKLSEQDIYKKIKQILRGKEPNEIGSWEKSKRDLMLVKLRSKGFSIREIERATGVSRGVIAKCNMTL